MPEVQTSPDAVAAFCMLVAAWMALWYLLGRVVDALVVSRLKISNPKHRAISLNKTIALLHAVYATAHAFYYYSYFRDDAPDQRYHCSESTWRSWRRLFPAGFVGYLVLDFIMELQKEHPGPLMLVHHAIFSAVAFISLAYEKGCMQYTVTLMSEASTVVFIVRWFLISVEAPQPAIKAAERLFALLFFVMRILFFGHGTWVSLTEDPEVFADSSPWQIVPIMYSVGYVMQVWWMYEIVMMAVKPPRKGKSGGATTKDK